MTPCQGNCMDPCTQACSMSQDCCCCDPAMMNQLQSQMPPAPAYPPQASQWNAVLLYFPEADPEEVHKRAALTWYVIFGLKPRPTRLRHSNQNCKRSNITFETESLPHLKFFWIRLWFLGCSQFFRVFIQMLRQQVRALTTQYYEQTGIGFELLYAELPAISQVCVPAAYTYCKL